MKRQVLAAHKCADKGPGSAPCSGGEHSCREKRPSVLEINLLDRGRGVWSRRLRVKLLPELQSWLQISTLATCRDFPKLCVQAKQRCLILGVVAQAPAPLKIDWISP